MYKEDVTMETTKIFNNRKIQTVIPHPTDTAWQTFINGLESFSDDLFENGRETQKVTERDTL